MAHVLPLTGERTLPQVAGEEYWFARHDAAYRWITTAWHERLRGARVLDAGSGEGYGAATLHSAGAHGVLALELDAAATQHAHDAYPTVATVRANLATLPVADASIDLVVCLQVVEHLWDLPAFLRDCRRVLVPHGLLVVSTPNRPVFSPGLARGERPVNPFHVEEFDAEQLGDLLTGAGFDEVVVLGVAHGPRLRAWEAEHGVGLVDAHVQRTQGTSPRPWDRDLDELLARLDASDFVVTARDAGNDARVEDLIAVGRRR